ncbi:MAG TPA: glycosyltransferase family 1 protein [Vicinamibacterales bacterium]|nr:glycosyltransferase family 1 protein [Vicinamibacterales bacterium]
MIRSRPARPLRILLDYRPALRQRTGVGEYVHELARALVATRGPSGQESLCLFSSSWQDRLAADVVPGATVIDRRVPVRLLNLLWHRAQWPSIETLAGGGFDIAHSAHPLLMPARHAAQVVMVHDLDFLQHPERSHREIRRDYPALAPAHIRAADAVAVNSPHTAAEVVRLTGVAAGQVFVCPLGRPDWTSRDAEPAGAPLLFLGSLEPRKNIGLLLDAYERLLAQRGSRSLATPRLVLAGAPGLESDAILQRVREPVLAPHVDVLGYVNPNARREVYASAMICIMPSHTEGFGLPALEAMTVGVPVVAADQGALPDVVGPAGTLFKSGDAGELASALDALIDDPNRRAQMREAGLAQSRLFSWAHTAARTRDAWAHAHEKARRARRNG